MPEGVDLYEAVPHRLTPVVAGDHRDKAGGRRRGTSAAKAPVKNCNRAALATELKLRPEQRVLFAQTVGRPLKSQPVR